MTPEREADILLKALTTEDLLKEMDRLREARSNQNRIIDGLITERDDAREKYARLKEAAETILHCSGKMVSSTIPGKTIIAIEVPLDDILNLRRELKGS